MRTQKTWALLGSAAVIGGTLVAAVPAQAAPPAPSHTTVDAQAKAAASARKQRRDVCFTGACGSATVTFTGRKSASVNMSVSDTKCDADGPKMRIHASQFSYANQKPYVWKGPWRKNTWGCGKGPQPWLNKLFQSEEPLAGMRVEICTKKKCQVSSWMYNPY
ncbi:hypothetical protein ACFQ7A_31485 [Streptomyces sp. NPDC056528]|uniref:hypothetical protein n=1 Tax=Streptomyces sp. NPDC056528 TaxID=3345854 RepID=UPI0036A04AC6